MKFATQCESCGHRQVAYTLPFNAGLLWAFTQFADKFIRGAKKGISKGDIGLTNSQYGNFQNLRHFGLIIQYEKGTEWYLTSLGEAFYFGEAGVLTPAGHMAGNTLSDTHEAWATHKVERRTVFIGDVLPTHYKRRADYQAEASRQQTLY